MARYFGGSLAPTIDEVKMSQFRHFEGTLDGPANDYYTELLELAELWWDSDVSTAEAKPGRFQAIVPLTQELQNKFYNAIPWPKELALMAETFETLTGEVRNCAFHLLWLANELNLNREPNFKAE